MFTYWLTDIRNPNRIDYVPELLAMARVDRAKLPDLRPVNSVLGTIKPEVAADLGLAPSTRVVMGSADGHAATLGAGTLRDYEGYFYVGTSSWMSCHVPAKKTDPLHMLTAMPAASWGVGRRPFSHLVRVGCRADDAQSSDDELPEPKRSAARAANADASWPRAGCVSAIDD